MKGKRTIPFFNAEYADNAEMMTIRTSTKKSHYICSDAKLYDNLVTAIRTTGDYFNLLLSTYPTVAVHINGQADKLKEHKNWLLQQVTDTLQNSHVHYNQ